MAIIKNTQGIFEKREDKRAAGEGIQTSSLTTEDLIKILIAKGLILEADIK